MTGKAPPGRGYAPATAAHGESVLRGFYDFHREAGTGPMVNPFPLARGRRGRVHAHHNPMEPYRGERSGRYRPRLARRAPHHIPEEKFNQLFAALGSHRDRALVAFWVSTGARASELLGATCRDADPGQQLIAVIRKGTRHLQHTVKAAPDPCHPSWRPAAPRPGPRSTPRRRQGPCPGWTATRRTTDQTSCPGCTAASAAPPRDGTGRGAHHGKAPPGCGGHSPGRPAGSATAGTGSPSAPSQPPGAGRPPWR